MVMRMAQTGLRLAGGAAPNASAILMPLGVVLTGIGAYMALSNMLEKADAKTEGDVNIDVSDGMSDKARQILQL